MILHYLFHIAFITLELCINEYNFIKNIEKNKNKILFFMLIDYIHNFFIFISYGFTPFILYSLFFYNKSTILNIIIFFNLVWFFVFLSYIIYDECIFLKIGNNIIPQINNNRFIDPSERLFYIFDQNMYTINRNKKNDKNMFNNTLLTNIYIILAINIIIFVFCKIN